MFNSLKSFEPLFPAHDLEFIVNSVDFSKLNNQKILLTGGTGFIGRWFLESFHFANQKFQLNARLTILTRNSERFMSIYPKYKDFSDINFWQTDILDFKNVEEKFSFIIHAAAESDSRLDSNSALKTADTIVKGTWNILELAEKMNTEYFLYLSSGAVYGNVSSPVNENYSGAPLIQTNFAYGESKRFAELLCKIFSEKIKTQISIARCFALVGPGLPLTSSYAIGNFIDNYLERTEILVKGDGTPLRSFIYSSDLMIWLWKILFESKSGSIYNVGSDEVISIKELAEKISKQEVTVKILEKDSGRKDNCYLPIVDKAKRELNLQITIGLDEAIEKTIQFYRN